MQTAIIAPQDNTFKGGLVSNKHRRRSGNRKRQPNNHQKQTPNATSDSEPSSHNLIFNHSQESVSDQLKYAKEQDNRAYVVMVIATALVSAAVVLQAVVPTNCNTTISRFLQIVPISLLGFTFLETIIIATIGWGVRKYWGQADTLTLYTHYLDKPEQDTKDALMKYSVNAYHENQKQLKIKAFWVKFATLALRRYSIVFVLFLIAQAILHVAC